MLTTNQLSATGVAVLVLLLVCGCARPTESRAARTPPPPRPQAEEKSAAEVAAAADRLLENVERQQAEAQPAEPVEVKQLVGQSKSAVLQKYGRPRNWGWFEDDGSFSIKPIYNLRMVSGPMPSSELWIFEYEREDGSLFCVRMKSDQVQEVAQGPLWPRDPSWKSKPAPDGVGM